MGFAHHQLLGDPHSPREVPQGCNVVMGEHSLVATGRDSVPASPTQTQDGSCVQNLPSSEDRRRPGVFWGVSS